MKNKEKFYKENFEINTRILLEDKWVSLISLLNENKKSHYLSFNEEESIKSFFSLDEEGTRKVYLIFDSSKKFIPDKKSQSIQVSLSKNDFFGETAEYIEIICKNPDKSKFIFNKFNALIAMIFVKIKFEEKNNYEAVKETIQEWRDFFRNEKQKYLNSEQIKGLIGELLTLKDLLMIDNNLFEVWHGPEAERHDFRSNNISIEVKASGSKRKSCKIGSLEQLDTPDDAKLYLQFYQLEKDDLGHSIPQLIKDIEKFGVSKVDLERKLNDLNYNFEHEKFYEDAKNKYRTIFNGFYEVDDEFPKIVSSSFINNRLPINIMELSYTINLSEAQDVEYDEKKSILNKLSKS